MQRSLRATLLTLTLPLCAASVALGVLEGRDLWNLRRDLASFQERSQAASGAEEAGRALARLERRALEVTLERRDPADLDAAQQELRESLATLTTLDLAVRDTDGEGRPLKLAIQEAGSHLDRYIERTSELSRSGKRDAAVTLVSEDLPVLGHGQGP